MTVFQNDENPLARVREGMQVIDARGAVVGTVKEVKMGDAQAATHYGQRSATDGSFLAEVKSLFVGGEPDVPGELATRLLRLGYIKIDGPGMLGPDRYAAADRVTAVDDQAVHLSVAEEQTVRKN